MQATSAKEFIFFKQIKIFKSKPIDHLKNLIYKSMEKNNSFIYNKVTFFENYLQIDSHLQFQKQKLFSKNS